MKAIKTDKIRNKETLITDPESTERAVREFISGSIAANLKLRNSGFPYKIQTTKKLNQEIFE